MNGVERLNQHDKAIGAIKSRQTVKNISYIFSKNTIKVNTKEANQIRDLFTNHRVYFLINYFYLAVIKEFDLYSKQFAIDIL